MLLEQLEMMIGGAGAVVTFPYLITFWLTVRSVSGTRLRYVATSWLIGLGALLALIFAVWAVLDLMLENYQGTGLNVMLTIAMAWSTKRVINNSDNWFNDQWKRLKRGLKKLKRRLASTAPVPAPSPA